MRDAYGGAVNTFIIVVFIVFTLGYMAFNINYTKAFKMKDKIISIYEKYQGCDDKCKEEIVNYSNEIGYKPDTLNCDKEGKKELYCATAVKVGSSDSDVISDRKTRCYYHITTKVEVKIPIIEYLLDIRVFDVSGDTKIIERKEGDSC